MNQCHQGSPQPPEKCCKVFDRNRDRAYQCRCKQSDNPRSISARSPLVMDIREQHRGENAELNEFPGCLLHDLCDLALRSFALTCFVVCSHKSGQSRLTSLTSRRSSLVSRPCASDAQHW